MLAHPEQTAPARARRSHIWAKQGQDWYVEPSWCSDRLFAVERFEGTICDPACGSGRIVTAARAFGLSAHGHDIVDRGFPGTHVADFFAPLAGMINCVSNPPYSQARRFVERALELTERKVAMLMPYGWTYGAVRSRWLQSTPLRRVYFIAPRPPMPPGYIIARGENPKGGRVDYAWFVWLRGYDGAPELGWLRREA